MRGDVAWMQPNTAKVALELQDAIAAIEAQRTQDLALLTGKLLGNISAANATYQRTHAAEKTKAETGVQTLALGLAKRRVDVLVNYDARAQQLRDRIIGLFPQKSH